MADHDDTEAHAGSEPPTAGGGGSHGAIHMPPNSWAPISTAFALCMTMVGFVAAMWVWIIGLVWLIASLYAWVRGARREYLELPDHGGQH